MRASFCILAALFAAVCTEIIGVRIDTSAAEITACNDSQCNQACTAALYQGYCKDGECWCWKNGQSARRAEKRITEIRSSVKGVGDCRDTQCDQACKPLRYSGGYCKDGQCWCWKQEESGRVEKPKSELESDLQCKTDACNLECSARRYNGGSCRTGECMCWKDRPERGTWLPINNPATNYKDKSGNPVEACTEPVECLDACQHHGAAGGFCLKRVCWCSMSYNRKASSNRRVRPIIDLQGNVTGNSLDSDDAAVCDRTVCSRMCKSNNKRAGVCSYGYCWCSDTKRQEEEPVWEKLSDIPH